MTIETPFANVAEADSAYWGDPDDWDDPNGSEPGGNPGEGWHDLEAIEMLAGEWMLFKQEKIDNSDRRFFLTHDTGDGNFDAMKPGGETEHVGGQTPLDDVPSFPTESDARKAHQTWLEENPDAVDGEDGGWSKWQQLNEIDRWHIYAREHTDGEHVQFLASGVLPDERTVYLHPDGSVNENAHVYTAWADLEAALEAYLQAVADGEIPEDQQPTGAAPPIDQIQQDGTEAAPDEGGIGAKHIVAAGAVVAAGVYARHEGHL